MDGADAARQQLAAVLRDVRALLALSGNDFAWSSWGDADAALAEVDGLVATLEAGRLPPWLAVSALFAPTGPIHEVSLRSGWADEFLTLAARYAAAVEAAYRASWVVEAAQPSAVVPDTEPGAGADRDGV